MKADQQSLFGEPEPPEIPDSDPGQERLRAEQEALLDVPADWTKNWGGMPAYNQRDLSAWESIQVNFANEADRNAFATLVAQTITSSTRSIWYPRAEIGRFVDKRYRSEATMNPRYPVYVISKGRWESRLTSKALEKIRVPYRIVVEPQEYDRYAALIAPEKILTLPFSNLGQGSIPARNWVWEHALSIGAPRHWILDDNISGFFRLDQNLKVEVESGSTFRAAEDFVDRYINVAQAGFNYFMFASRKDVFPPFILNTRIYSCILLKTDMSYRWRGRYNEDTDLSLRILKDGLCTVLFNAFLAYKRTTMTMKGGNTDELYQGDGRREMAESLQAQHPEVVTVVRKFDRWQHQVNYKPFRRNKLLLRPDAVIPEGIDDYGMTRHALDLTATENKQQDEQDERNEAT